MNKYYRIDIRVDEETFDIINKLVAETGLSQREILAYSSQPCGCCPDTEITAYNSKDRNVKIPRGILFNSLLTKYGSYVKSIGSDKKDK